MRVNNYYSISVISLFSFCILVLLSACSNSTNDLSANKKQKSQKEVTVKSRKPDAKENQHTHPSNPCTAEVAHSHLYKEKEHEHSYDCENTNKYISNAHIHPATAKNKKFRHVHPNGNNKHTHHKE